ncbi:MAG: hypothetical protein M3Q23_01925 [Actinomycetota bacterium]|nr:hypothetical protein [Actinomycetota bacterium]
MIRPLPPEVASLLDRGALCHLGLRTTRGMHATPVVYTVSDHSLWVTTARRSVKARTWRADPRVAGLVRTEEGSLVFGGTVRTYDLLDPTTWMASAASAHRITAAAVAFTTRNARFFAGYAVDARKVPLSWTPPGRVFARVDLERIALVGAGGIRTWGRFSPRVGSHESFRAPAPPDRAALDGVPDEVRDRVGVGGPAALALGGRHGPLVIPASWLLDRGWPYAAVPQATLALAGVDADCPASLTVDHASTWRASAMTGVLLQGTASMFVIGRLRSGGRSASAIAKRAGLDPEGAAVIRLNTERVVWWKGWSGGTVRQA